MGTKDTITKDYMADNRVFADVFNHMLYKGKNVIDPDTLHPVDTTALAVPYGSDTSEVPVQKFRDEFKSLNVMHDDSRIYLLLGIENQSEQHYAMPVKNLVYDALEYAGQVENSAQSHRAAKQWPSTSGEYLTGFYKDDRLIPVITVVVYFGSDTWKAPRSLHEMLSVQDLSASSFSTICESSPRSLHEMLSVQDPEILSMVPDYQINLFSPAEIKDEELNKLQSNLREVMLFIKYAKDKRKLKELTSENSSFQSLELKAARVIDSITGINLRFTETEGSVNMCQAVQEMCDDARAEGHASGLIEGRTAGLSEGHAQGLQDHALLTAQRMLLDSRFSPEDISRFSGLPLEDVLKLREK